MALHTFPASIRTAASPALRAAAGTLLVLASSCASGSRLGIAFPEGAAAIPDARPAGSILMVLSAAPIQTLSDGSTRATGYFLNEFYEPYRALTEAGYAVAIATPGGRPPALDPESIDPKYWKDRPGELGRARKLAAEHPRMLSPLNLDSLPAQAGDFQAIVVPGGQGVMVDLLDHQVLHGLLREFGASHRPVGLICHAPAILTRMGGQSGPFAGRRVTSVSGIEEWYIETFVMDARAKVRRLGARLEDSGFLHDSAFPGSAHAIRDCSLVTSQNPFSGAAFNKLFLDALADWRRGGYCIPGRDG
jgi:putative intracellular protease/amidase